MNVSENEPTDDLDRQKTIDQLVESFVGRLRAGEQPLIVEYQRQHPYLADEIGQLFPSLEMLERCRPQQEAARPRLFDAEDIPPDQLGEYRIVREIGRGGMGIVYEADHVQMQRRVALKVLPKSIAQNASNVDRFQQEARSAGQLHHTNIVPVFEVGEDHGFHFYAMQFIRGQNLDSIIDEIRALREQGGEVPGPDLPVELTDSTTSVDVDDSEALSQTVAIRMLAGGSHQTSREESHQLASALDETGRTSGPERGSSGSIFGSSEWSVSGRTKAAYFHRVAALGLQVADALMHAHQNNLLHRDIKPSNLILDTDGIVWITDFGLAKGIEDALTQTGDIVGTLRYMAPERFQGQTDSRCDVYSLGLTLYELCTLQVAFQNTDRASLVEQVTRRAPVAPRAVEPSIPLDLETIILKAIDRNPDRRYQTSRHLAEDLQAFLADRPIQARRITLTERLWRACRRNPVAAAMSAVSLLMLLTVAVGATIAAIHFNRQSQKLRAQSQELQTQNTRATSHLALTEETIEKMLSRVGHDLAGVPQMDGIRHGLFSEALELQKEVLALEPDNPQVAMRTIGAYRRMALIQQQIGQYQAAKETLHKTLALIEAIPGADPQKLFEKGRAHTLLASWLRVGGDMSSAEEQAHLSIEALQQIPDADRIPEHRVALANAQRQLGAMLEQTGKTEASERALRTALETLDAISDSMSHGEQLIAVTETLNSLAILCRASSRFEEAERHYRRVIELCQRNQDLTTGRLDILDQMGLSALNLGNLLMLQRRHDDAADAYEQASKTFGQLQRDFPLTVRFQRRSAQAQLSLGLVHSQRNETDNAEHAYLQAIRKSEMIDAVYGDNPGSLDTQAVAFNNLGNLLKKQDGRLGEAIAAFEKSIALRERRGKLQHADPTNTKSIALARANLADTFADQDQYDRAHEVFLEAYEDIAPLVTSNPRNPSYLRVADFVCGNLVNLLADMGRYEEIEMWVDRLAELRPADPQQQLKAARQLKGAAETVRLDNGLSDESRSSHIDGFAERAIGLVRRAIECGWVPESTLGESSEFEWLRDRKAFQQLVEDVESS